MAAKNMLDLSKYSDLHYDAFKNNANATPIYGPYERLFLSDWGHSQIHYDITQAFTKMNINKMAPIQQNSFLHLMDHNNIAMVGFSKGKSTCYLASIFSLIMNSGNDKMNKAIIEPKAIILSSSLGSCSMLDNLSKQLLRFSSGKIKVVVAYSSISVNYIIAALCNGCDVLIATPISLFNVLLQSIKYFSWLSVKHLVLDNVDLLLENYADEMVQLLKVLTKCKENNPNIQMIAASVKWTRKMNEYLNKLFVKWQYVFGSHLEAACYMNIEFNVMHVKDNKLEKIFENLKNNTEYRRCVLITSDPDKLLTIYNYIDQRDPNLEVLLPDHIKSFRFYTLKKWYESLANNRLVLICSDSMMFDFYIDNADCLIHYDIPASKQSFSIRFSVLQDSSNKMNKRECSTYIFLSNSNEDMLQLPKLVEIMKAFGNGKVAPVLLEQSKLINETLEKEKKNTLLCNSIQQFGFCSNQINCQNRHILLKDIDEPAINIPRSGMVTVEILHVYDASHMSAKILKRNSTNNIKNVKNWSVVDDYSDTINEGLSLLYSEHDSRTLHQNIKIGDVVAVQLENKIKKLRNAEFFRATVIGFLDTHTMNPKAVVKLIDLGYIDIVSKWRVYRLPDKWKNMPTNTVDIFLTSVKPVDYDKTWCSKAKIHVQKELKFAQDCSNSFIVNVKMALGTTLWVNKLYKRFWNSMLQSYDVETILPDILFNVAVADINNEHIKNLTDLCVKANIEVPLSIRKNEENCDKLTVEEFMLLSKLPKPQWAHLDKGVTAVSLEYIISPKMFFVCQTKFFDQIKELCAKINQFINEEKVEKLKFIVEGAICLAKYKNNNQYCRGKIVELISDTCVEVMFVDLGVFELIETNTLLTIHPKLITRLPFQAIECSLSGVKDTLPAEPDKLDELVDFVFDLTQGTLYLEVVDTVSPVKFTGSSHYDVVLFDECITINLEFMTKFGQYCDEVQMSKIRLTEKKNTLVETDDEESPIVDENKPEPYIINVDNIENEDTMLPEELKSKQMFFDQFGQSLFGQYYKNMNKVEEENVENMRKKQLATITNSTESVDLAIKNKNFGDDPAKTESKKETESEDIKHIKPMDSIVPKNKFPLKNHKVKPKVRQKIPCLTCNIYEPSSIIAMCVWYQDENNIYLKFNILGIDEFSIDCTKNSILFKAKVKDKLYAFQAVLYAYIFETNVTHKRSYEGFHIKAEKLYKTKYQWPHLFACDKWHKYLKYDPEHIEIKDWTVFLKVLNTFKMLAVGTPLNHLNSDDDNMNSLSDCDLNLSDTELCYD